MGENYSSKFERFEDLDQHLGHMPDALIHHNGIRMAMNQMPVLFYGANDLSYTVTSRGNTFSVVGTTRFPHEKYPFRVLEASIKIDENGNLIYKEACSNMQPVRDEYNLATNESIGNVHYRESKYSKESGIEMMQNVFEGSYKASPNLSTQSQALLDVVRAPDRLSGKESIADILKYEHCGITQAYRTKELLGIAIVNNDSLEKKGYQVFERSNYGIYGVNGDVPARLQYDLYSCFEENGVTNAFYRDQIEGLDYKDTLIKYNDISLNGYYTQPAGFKPHAYDLLNETYIRSLEEKASKVR